MPLGRRALDQTTPYLVYEFRYNGKVFYVGVAHGHIRHEKRWSHVVNLEGDPSCGTYLRGVYDGVRTGKGIICPRGDIEDVQLRERFIASMAAAQKLKNYDDAPAATIALASFKFFMPCK